MTQEVRDVEIYGQDNKRARVEQGWKYNPSIYKEAVLIDFSWYWIETGEDCGYQVADVIEASILKKKIRKLIDEGNF